MEGKRIKFGQRIPLANEQARGDGRRLEPAADAQELHRPRLSATDQITDPMVSRAPITASMSDTWT